MSFTARLVHALTRQSGIAGYDQIPAALAAVVAVSQGIDATDIREMFAELAVRLHATSDLDSTANMRDWLREPELSEQQLQELARLLPRSLPQPIDWTAELAGLIELARYRDAFVPISTGIGAALGDALQLPRGETVACLHAGSATIAWGLAMSRPVKLHVARRDVSVVMGLLAYADERPLHASMLNPIEFLAPPDPDALNLFDERHSPRFGQFDHVIAIPPLGLRIKDRPGSGMLYEAWQVEQLAPRVNKTFISLATDGLLFRENRTEVEFRQYLCMLGGLRLTSLPPGIFGRASGVQVNLLEVEPLAADGHVTFVDGRSMDRISRSGKEQEELIIARLNRLANAPARRVSVDEIEQTGFSLLPSRYIVSDEIARLDEALADRPVVRLGDIARIIRPRAPQPARGDFSKTDLVCLEIAVADLIDGKVGAPTREVRFPATEVESVKKAMVRSDDILVSIKGNVGVVGLVDASRNILNKVMGTPEVVSQSLAIIRLEEGGPIRSARVLAGILASPQMRAKLQAMAAGTTVATLPIGALQDLPVPVPSAVDSAEIEARLDELDEMQADIDERVANRRIMQDALWRKFWNMPSDEEEA